MQVYHINLQKGKYAKHLQNKIKSKGHLDLFLVS